ncbi:HB2D protein, partial [Pycnonotus jocosus]|nr:HB2D protein [Pycnonotus jocosus]
GALPGLCPAHSGVFQYLGKSECHFINGTEKVRFVERHIYNREQFLMFDSDVGHFVGFTPYGEMNARNLNSQSEWMEYMRAEVDRHCRHNYKLDAPFTVQRRVPPSPSQSITSLSQ